MTGPLRPGQGPAGSARGRRDHEEEHVRDLRVRSGDPGIRIRQHHHRRVLAGPAGRDRGFRDLRRHLPERRVHPHQDVRLPGGHRPARAGPGAARRGHAPHRGGLAGPAGPDLRPDRPDLRGRAVLPAGAGLRGRVHPGGPPAGPAHPGAGRRHPDPRAAGGPGRRRPGRAPADPRHRPARGAHLGHDHASGGPAGDRGDLRRRVHRRGVRDRLHRPGLAGDPGQPLRAAAARAR